MIEVSDRRSDFARDAWIRALRRIGTIERNPQVTLPVLLQRLADERESAAALVADEETLTYRDLERRCNQFARWGILQGLKPGDTVALLMSNCAEYLAVWLGLTRIGVIVALANTHVSGETLAHAINGVAARLVIAGAGQAAALAGARDFLPAALVCRVRGACSADFAPIESAHLDELDEPLTAMQQAFPSIDDPALYIYTSGTTGLPKAAKVSHRRLMQWSLWFAGMLDTGPQDRMYDCLPLYHSVGGVVATGATLAGGGTVIIRSRFSVSGFWRDVCEQRCTLFQYIGELCRYLVNAPRQAAETQHGLRLACGNGLRPEIWRTFEDRFRIPRILEYYAATEGTFSLYNCEGELGSIGRIPPYLRHHLPVELLRVDTESGEPWRDAAGFCRRCGTGEVGEAVGLGRFEGYVDAQASERKLLRHVFKAGDIWYRTGDLLRRDARGFYFFVDRMGDTFRWKGENVSTTEVLSVLTRLRGVLEGVVYGVAVPGTDGRAGMAALIVDSTFDLGDFRRGMTQRLPAYARPLFLRLLPRLETTGTFKPVMRVLARGHFDPAEVADPLYFNSAADEAFVVLDAALYRAIVAGRIRV